jgi:transposase
MSDTVIEKLGSPKADEWAERIAAQQRSGISVKQFCKEQGVSEYSFYAWRKRLQESGPVRFALVERRARRQERTAEPALDWCW